MLLSWSSARHYGLVNDDGSPIVFFGWRFAPSLLVVIYVQLTAMLLNDVKRTEPFARMARPGGASALSTVLQTPGAWWNALFEGFSNKKTGRRSHILVSSALLNVIGFLTISPLSPSLLEPTDVTMPNTLSFTRLVPKGDGSLSLDTGRETYLNIIAHVLRNVSTSAWISDDYVSLPFWPSGLPAAALGPVLSTSRETWQAKTVVLKAELECSPMSLVRLTRVNESYHDDTDYTSETVSMILSSDDGCRLGLANQPELSSRGATGESFWTEFSKLDNSSWQSGKESRTGSGITTTNFTKECGSRELFISYSSFLEDDVRVSAHVCSSHYYMANVTVAASSSGGTSVVNIDEKDLHERRTDIPSTFINISKHHNLVSFGDWSPYLRSYTDRVYMDSAPSFANFSLLLAGHYDFNLTAMISDPDSVTQAARVRQRVLGEMLQYSLLQQSASQSENFEGRAFVIQSRVVVNSEVAITLSVLLTISFALLLLVWYSSRPRVRPLELEVDPATTIGIVSLIASGTNAREDLQRLNQPSKTELTNILHPKTYYTYQNVLFKTPSNQNTGNGKILECGRTFISIN